MKTGLMSGRKIDARTIEGQAQRKEVTSRIMELSSDINILSDRLNSTKTTPRAVFQIRRLIRVLNKSIEALEKMV